VVSFSVATSESWKDKDGQRQERTQWHRVAIFNERLGEVAEKYLRKGSKVYLEGRIESRKYTDKDGQEREITEIVLPRFGGELTLLDSKNGSGEASEGGGSSTNGGARSGGWDRSARSGGVGRDDKSGGSADLDDEIPFLAQLSPNSENVRRFQGLKPNAV
jgi:single-strand DNA-binding protein